MAPKEATNGVLAGYQYGTLVARLPAFWLVLGASHAVTRVFGFQSPSPHGPVGLGCFFTASNAVPWPRSLRVHRIQFLRRKLKNKWISRQASVSIPTRQGGLQRLGSNFCGSPILCALFSLLFLFPWL